MKKQLLLIIICLLPSLSFAQLSPGKHLVGFKTIQAYDLSRPFLPQQQAGILKKIPERFKNKGRQIQLSLWYPAKKNKKSQPITFEYYIHQLSQISAATGLNKSTKAKGWELFLKDTKDLGGTKNTLARLKKIGNVKTLAHLNAPFQNGQYPLVLFPSIYPSTQISLMAEYLASRGYIVAGVPNLGITSTAPEINAAGLNAMAQDVLFALGHLSALENVNQDKVALIGNAYNSTVAAMALLMNSNIDALISLEGGLLSNYEQRILQQHLLYEVAALNRPLLAIYAPHPSINPKNVRHFKYADRYFVHFPQMKEYHFLSYGSLEQQIPQIIGKTPKNVSKGFEWGCRFVHQFLDARLKNDIKALGFLQNSQKNQKGIWQAHTQPGLPSPPSMSRLKHIFTTKGMKGIEELYQSMRKKDAAPFSVKYFDELFKWLGWASRDPKLTFRYKLAAMMLESHPKSPLGHYFKAAIANAKKEAVIAQKHFQLMLKYLKKGTSNYLTTRRISRLKSYAQRTLDKLAQAKKGE